MSCKRNNETGSLTGSILNDSESNLFDMIASDLTRAAGVDLNYYSMEKGKSNIDPLYGEYQTREYEGPWLLPSYVQWPQQSPMSGDSGYTVEFDGKVTVARVEFETHNAPYPVEGDIVEFWRTPYHDIDSRGKGLFFDVIKVDNDGHVNDSPTFVQFKLTLKRRPQFAAERKLAEDISR